ncbi:hypothetical protein [Dolichospermum circinale]|uniref:hypothetical protein n=1 Tax=Dolichospermum circinale TaxID=109265 RepID=UPI000403749E|nr:hypothetical protein [Dolichospermum circinale]MDB9455347.1 hypothetical protein [Dolichospermum circinale CS-541/06]MDB9462734.1 hypothetical protein [Dolichospermum circinale CS-541/04]MDB9476099.1 hypothetical protein [Dolichospermum circinale CS-537/11]MDB9480528.1 hypothetical protein [Dolichospermum circinale CS-537/03]MDB9490584.1 hypothetical protein [Dolichospermum circinale CS-534/05]
MRILFNQKFKITAFITSLLVVGFMNKQPIQKQQTTENLSLSPIVDYPIVGLSNNLLTQKPSHKSILYSVINEWKQYQYSINSHQVLTTGKLPNNQINFNQTDLLSVLTNTREYFQKYASEDPDLQRTGILITQGVTVKDILKTLDFMITVLEEDIANKRTTRLQDPSFINTNFRVIKWSAHNPENPQQKQLRITKYAAFIHPGSREKTSKYNTPIYALKEELSQDKFYTKYTKQDVLSGIYEPGGKEFGKVKPIAYLTRNGLEAALMQGTVLVNFTDGTKEFLNVDKNNGMSYIRGVKATSQKRYWYFKEVDAIKGYGYKIDAKISIKPGVTFAGDVLNIGLGRIIVIEDNQNGKKRLKMGVIADTGGAFLPNLYQLDFLAGTFASEKDFQQYIHKLPEYTNAYILVKK